MDRTNILNIHNIEKKTIVLVCTVKQQDTTTHPHIHKHKSHLTKVHVGILSQEERGWGPGVVKVGIVVVRVAGVIGGPAAQDTTMHLHISTMHVAKLPRWPPLHC